MKKTIKSISLWAGIIGSIATCLSFLTQSTSAQSTTGDYSPAVNGNGNTINYGGLDFNPEAIHKNKPNITIDQYNELKPGMTYAEVLDIIKIPGTQSAMSNNIEIYTWGNATYVYLMLTFVDGKLQSKNQSSL